MIFTIVLVGLGNTPTRTGEGHDRVGVSNYFNFSSTTVGQHGMNDVQTADEQNIEG